MRSTLKTDTTAAKPLGGGQKLGRLSSESILSHYQQGVDSKKNMLNCCFCKILSS